MAFSFNELKAKAEAHPYITAGIIFTVGAVIIYWYYSGSSSGSTSDGGLAAAQAAAVQSNNALQAAQLGYGVQSQSIAAQQEVSDSQTAASLKLGEEQLNDSLKAAENTNSTTVSLANIAANVQENNNANTDYLANIQSIQDVNATAEATGAQEQENIIQQSEVVSLINLIGERTQSL
jgi:hypothetical protein